MMVETYLRRGKRSLQRLVLDPKVRITGAVLAYGGSGFLMSAASLGGFSQPLAMGMICATTGWRTLVMSLGAMVGYPAFWGAEGNQGIVWSAASGLLALLVGKREESKEQPLMIPFITAFLAAVTGLCFQTLVGDKTPVPVYFLRIALALFSGILFTQFSRCRDAITDWLVGAVAVLALSQVWLTTWLGLGYVAAGMLAVSGAFPAAALAGLGLDLAQVTALPMTAVLCLACFLGMIPFHRRWQRYAVPGIACAGVMAACRVWDLTPLPGLILGGALGALLPPRPAITRRRGETGVAQVRLEIGAELLGTLAHLLQEHKEPAIDESALLEKVRQRACAGCSLRGKCTQRETLTIQHLQNPLEADCARQNRLLPELRREGEQWKRMKADRLRRREYRDAMVQQYRFLGDYLRSLADRLPRGAQRGQIAFRVEISARSRGKERANGDKCVAFSGGDCSYYILLCDGMGTGLEAAREGSSAAGLLQKMLAAGFPAEHALNTLNSFLALQGEAGAVTVDLAQIRLDTGHARIFKWGASASYVLSRSGAEKIGTASPPPGLSVSERREEMWKLSLRRGEVLILLSDGAEGEGLRHLSDLSPDAPPGELAAKILEMGGGSEDDATAAVIRLRPTGMATS